MPTEARVPILPLTRHEADFDRRILSPLGGSTNIDSCDSVVCRFCSEYGAMLRHKKFVFSEDNEHLK